MRATTLKLVARQVRCGEHGDVGAAFVCQHLTLCGPSLGFYMPTVDGTEPTAWCDLCERARIAAGGVWNDESEAIARPRLTCTECFARMRSTHER